MSTLLELILMITFVMQLRWSSISIAYDEFYMLKTTQGYLAILCI